MLIELWRKVLATDHQSEDCGICGNDFDRGAVFAMASADDGAEMGAMCPTCLDYLSRRGGGTPAVELYLAHGTRAHALLAGINRYHRAGVLTLDRCCGMNQIKSSANPRSGRPSRSFSTCPAV